MARRNKPALPGLSRSTACTKTKSCARLDGHRKACRTTLTRTAAKLPVAVKAPVRRSARKARTAKLCRVNKAGIRCSRAYGHKAEGLRHRFDGLVTILPEGESKVSRTQLLGTAKRAKAAPQGTKSRSNAGAVRLTATK